MLLRLLIADLVGEDATRASIATLRDDIAELSATLAEAEARADALPHRRKYLLLATRFLRACSSCTSSSSTRSSGSWRRGAAAETTDSRGAAILAIRRFRASGPLPILGSMRPLIGVTTSEVRVAQRHPHTPEADPPRSEMALGISYSQAIAAAGGLPVVLPPVDLAGIEPLLEPARRRVPVRRSRPRPRGVRRRAGPAARPDVARPRRLRARASPAAPTRSSVPLLAICRGMQTLNVARGGTLHQHSTATARPCRASSRRTRSTSRRTAACARSPAPAGSRSTRSTTRRSPTTGSGLRAVAWADDGVVEAVESAGARFLLGVQWHAEGLVARPEQLALFSAFVDAARDHVTGLHVRAA